MLAATWRVAGASRFPRQGCQRLAADHCHPRAQPAPALRLRRPHFPPGSFFRCPGRTHLLPEAGAGALELAPVDPDTFIQFLHSARRYAQRRCLHGFHWSNHERNFQGWKLYLTPSHPLHEKCSRKMFLERHWRKGQARPVGSCVKAKWAVLSSARGILKSATDPPAARSLYFHKYMELSLWGLAGKSAAAGRCAHGRAIQILAEDSSA